MIVSVSKSELSYRDLTDVIRRLQEEFDVDTACMHAATYGVMRSQDWSGGIDVETAAPELRRGRMASIPAVDTDLYVNRRIPEDEILFYSTKNDDFDSNTLVSDYDSKAICVVSKPKLDDFVDRLDEVLDEHPDADTICVANDVYDFLLRRARRGRLNTKVKTPVIKRGHFASFDTDHGAVDVFVSGELPGGEIRFYDLPDDHEKTSSDILEASPEWRETL